MLQPTGNLGTALTKISTLRSAFTFLEQQRRRQIFQNNIEATSPADKITYVRQPNIFASDLVFGWEAAIRNSPLWKNRKPAEAMYISPLVYVTFFSHFQFGSMQSKFLLITSVI